MALTVVVDERDNVTGYRERETYGPGDNYRITILCVFNMKGQVLLAQRSPNKKRDAGRWSPAAGGTVEQGETYESNIYKEAEEELGISGVEFHEGPNLYAADIGNGAGYFCQTYYVYLEEPAESFVLQSEEVAAVKWVDIERLELHARTHPEQYTINFADSLEAVREFMHGG